ncbi:MAG: ArgE/DapE family deacylase [Cephaloticoccus sp.]|nr:ArgE/DapE family deacylase [Akkermansiaceae bacterium]MCF7761354.1 ArgE/DapE family deacylase [Cephaloticoccus sp.]
MPLSPSAYIDTHSADLVRRLQKLVGTSTVNPPGENYASITAYLVAELNAIGLKARRLNIPAAQLKQVLPPEQHAFPRYNVLGKLAARGARKTIHFNAHYDVVPVSGKWKHGSPLSGTVSGDWIYGRGTADMKGSIASLLLALQALTATKTAPKMNVEVSFTADEETDSLLGAGWLVEHAPIKPDYAIVMEGGELDQVCCGHNGVVWLEVTVHGQAAHGSTPQEGINALEKMSALVLALDHYRQQLTRRSFKAPDGRIMIPTINVGGMFSSGEGGKINTVPALARFTIDRRVLAVETVATVEAELRKFLAATARKIPQCRITVAKISDNHPCYNAPTHPFFTAMADTVSRVRKQPSSFRVSSGFNDMHFFSHHLKIPTLGYGPGGEDIHAIDERANLRELIRAAKIYAELLTTFAG